MMYKLTVAEFGAFWFKIMTGFFVLTATTTINVAISKSCKWIYMIIQMSFTRWQRNDVEWSLRPPYQCEQKLVAILFKLQLQLRIGDEGFLQLITVAALISSDVPFVSCS